MWLSREGILEPRFQGLTKTIYSANVETLDFSDPRKAIAHMNAAISGDTNGRVKQLFAGGSVDKNSTLVLANTVYFKGLWAAPFDKQKTAMRPFYPLDRQQSMPCVTMMQSNVMAFHEEADFQAIGIPFSGAPDLSMIFLLPAKRDGLRDLEKTLSSARLQEIADKMTGTAVTAFIPKFSFSVGGGYVGVLANLGVSKVFDVNQADLTGMCAKLRPHIRDVLHETTIEVNEAGGEVAAVTAVPVDPFGPGDGATPQGLPRRVVFVADHPFVFLVRHRPTGLVLFLGRFAGP
jgi:serine protease inhibitor